MIDGIGVVFLLNSTPSPKPYPHTETATKLLKRKKKINETLKIGKTDREKVKTYLQDGNNTGDNYARDERQKILEGTPLWLGNFFLGDVGTVGRRTNLPG